jgi:hypothetical protein
MRPYLITAKLMRPSNMKRFPTPDLDPYEALHDAWAEHIVFSVNVVGACAFRVSVQK